jgi:hypothetical protein
LEDIDERHLADSSAKSEHDNAHKGDDCGDDISESLDLAQQSRFYGLDRGHYLIDTPQLRKGSRSDDHASSTPRGDKSFRRTPFLSDFL